MSDAKYNNNLFFYVNRRIILSGAVLIRLGNYNLQKQFDKVKFTSKTKKKKMGEVVLMSR